MKNGKKFKKQMLKFFRSQIFVVVVTFVGMCFIDSYTIPNMPYKIVVIILMGISMIMVILFIISGSIQLYYILKEDRLSLKDYCLLLSTFYLLVFVFAFIYLVIYGIDNTSFVGVCADKENEFFAFFYFSVITFTTLGYGDIQPVSILARSVAMVEVLLFVVYISIILLSMNRNRIDQQKETPSRSSDTDKENRVK